MKERSSELTPAEAVRMFWEDVWTEGRVEVLSEIFHPEMKENAEPQDVADWQRGVAKWREAWPDFSATIEELFTVGDDRVVSRVTYRGTHSRTFWGLEPTGNKTEVIGIDLFRVDSGRIIELWHATDHLILVQQMGGTVRPKQV